MLDIDPKFASAYVAKVCVTFQLRREAELAETTFQYEDNADWRKAMRFANPQQKAVYENYAAKVKERTERQIRDYSYDCAMEMAVNPYANKNKLDKELSYYKVSCTHSDGWRPDGSRRQNSQMNEDAFRQTVKSNEPGDLSEQSFNTAAAMFDEIKDSDAAECAGQCRTLAEQARQKKIYKEAVAASQSNRVPDLRQAQVLFASIPQYKDAEMRAKKTQEKIDNIQASIYAEAVQAMQNAKGNSWDWLNVKHKLSNRVLDNYRDVAALRIQAEKQHHESIAKEDEMRRRQAARKKKMTILGSTAAAVVIAIILLVTQVIIPSNNYNHAVSLRAAEDWDGAREAFASAGGYSDAAMQIKATYYAEGKAKRAAGEWTEAVEAFTNAGDYSDTTDQIKATYYAEGEAKREAGEWTEAVEAFTNAGDYSDAATQIKATYYAEGEAKRAAGEWTEAVEAFKNAGDYSDAAMQIKATYYAEGEAKRAAGEWTEAVEAFKNAGDYSDAVTQIKVTYYAEGEAKREAEDWDEAREAFASAGDYSDAATQIKATYYAEGEAKREAGEWTEAVEAFKNAGDYSDAATQIKETEYQKAQALYASADYANAYTTYKSISGYKDVDNLIANDQNLAAAAALEAKFTVGNYVEFGTYPQTASGMDSTPIEWLVLARDGNKALLISRYGLDAQPYNEEWTSVTWEKCTLRTWLNGTFMNKAFTANEQTGILLTNVDNSSSQGYSGWKTKGGNNTQDKIFLLSYAEANQYLDVTKADSNNMKSRVAPTAYAKEQGAYRFNGKKTADGDGSGWWWLRSLGYNLRTAANVNYDGSLHYGIVYYDSACVRPALWINLESGIF